MVVEDPVVEVLHYLYDRVVSDGSSLHYERTVEGAEATYTDALDHTTEFLYDADGNLTQLTDAADNVTIWTYDDHGNRLTETNEIGTRTYEYDTDDRLVEATDRNGRVREFDYDTDGRLTEENWLDSLGDVAYTIEYDYDAEGRLESASDTQSEITYTYDANGFLDVVTTTGTAVGATVGIDYDANTDGTVASATVTVDGVVDHVEEFDYDAEGRLIQVLQHGVSGGASVAEKRVDFTYFDGQRFATMTRYADLGGTELVATSTFTYTEHGQLAALVHARGAAELAAYAWTYTDSGAVASFTNDTNAATYSYDATGQLIGVANSDAGLADLGYNYDATGNRTGGDYATDPGNIQTSGAGATYTYDAEGQRTRRNDATTGDYQDYEWDHRGRLIGVKSYTSSHTLVQSVEFAYDALNQRIAKVVRDGTNAIVAEEHYVLETRDLTPSGTAGGVQSQANLDDLVAVLDGSGQVVERYVYGTDVDQVLAVEIGTGTRWLLADNLGSIRAEVTYNADTDTTSVVKVVDYDAFGNEIADSAPGTASRFGYTGREFDGETGLQFNRARYYDPATGRWVSQDPKGFAAGDYNLYRYVGNGVTGATDPSGQEEVTMLNEMVNEPFPEPEFANTNDGRDKWYNWVNPLITVKLGARLGQWVIGGIEDVLRSNGYETLADGTLIIKSFGRFSESTADGLNPNPWAKWNQAVGIYDRAGNIYEASRGGGYSVPGSVGLTGLGLVADMTGVTSVEEAYEGKDLLSQEKLTFEQRSDRGVAGGNQLASTAVGGAKAISSIKVPGMSRSPSVNRGGNANPGKGRAGAPVGDVSQVGNCFAAGTPILTPEGFRLIEDVVKGDYVFSRDEHDPRGAVQSKIVEEIFIRQAEIFNLVFNEIIIRTTQEHPVYVQNIGWKCACELQPGDHLLCLDGSTVALSAAYPTGEYAPVYNMRVADFHTYFVGCAEWSFSIWVHNANYVVKEVGGQYYLFYENGGRVLDTSGYPLPAYSSQRSLVAGLANRMNNANIRPLQVAPNATTNAARYGVNLDALRPTATVAGHLDRPYINSPATIRNIIESAPPRIDPGGVPTALRWDVRGSYGSSVGTYELVIDTQTNRILHFQFRGGR